VVDIYFDVVRVKSQGFSGGSFRLLVWFLHMKKCTLKNPTTQDSWMEAANTRHRKQLLGIKECKHFPDNVSEKLLV